MNGHSRRDFLKCSSTAAAWWLAGNMSGRAEEQPPRRVTTGAAQLFVDLATVESLENVQQLFHAAVKHPDNPVLVGEREWERVMGGPCASFIYDDEEGRFKVWYQGVIGDRRGREHTYGAHTLNYAVSADGIRWERPNLGLHEFAWQDVRTTENNIVVPQTHHDGKDHWESVLKDPLTDDPDRRYKAIGWSSFDWDGPQSGIYSMTSPDGLSWNHSAEPIFRYHPRPGSDDLGPVGDAQSLMIDTRQRRYVAFLRGTGGSRLYSTSDDFVRWTPPAESMAARPAIAGTTLYNHLGFCYGDSYLGLVTYYHVRADGVRQLTLRLLSSPDGLRYEFPGGPAGADPALRPLLVETGEIGEWDRFMVMLTGAPPIVVGDRLYIYYRGYSETHDRSGAKPADSYYAGANGLATLRLDGFASLAAGFDGGSVTTRPVLFQGQQLLVNAKANHFGSQVRVEALNLLGQPIPGYTLEESVPMNADQVGFPVAWKERAGLAELADRPVKFRFHLNNARLYAWRVAESRS